MTRFLRSLVSLSMAVVMLAMAPGLPCYQALAQMGPASTMGGAGKAGGEAGVAGASVSGVQLELFPVDMKVEGMGMAPAVGAAATPEVSPTVGAGTPSVETAATPAVAASVEAPAAVPMTPNALPEARQDASAAAAATPMAAVSKAVAATATDVAAAVKNAGEASKMEAGQAQGVARQVFNRLTGANETAGSGEAVGGQGVMGAVVSALKKAGYPGHAAIKAQKLTETTFVVFDIEISSFRPFAEVTRTTEIGAVKFRLGKNGELRDVETFSQLVDPQVPLSYLITELTGLTQRDLKGQPTIDQVLPKFQEFVGSDSVLVAHNALFDVSVLGHQMKALGLPVTPNLAMDTKAMVKSLFPEIKRRSAQNLIDLWGLGGLEEHRGLSDAGYEGQFFLKAVQKLSETKKAGLDELTVGDLAEHSEKYDEIDAVLDFGSAADQIKGAAVEPERRQAIPDNFEAVVRAKSEEIHKQGKATTLGRIAYELGYDYDELVQKMREGETRNMVAAADEILAEISAHPRAGIITDFDWTLNDRGSAGKSLGIPDYNVKALEENLRRGIPVAVVTARNFDYQPPEFVVPETGKAIGYELKTALVDKIDPALRHNMIVVGSHGGEVVTFDAQGNVAKRMVTEWTAEEKPKIFAAVDRALEAAGVAKGDVADARSNPNQGIIVFKADQEAKAAEFAKVLRKEFVAAELPYTIFQNKNWVYWTKFTKADGVRQAFQAMQDMGFKVTPQSLLIMGDSFHMNPGEAPGGDAAMALPFPEALAVTVGDKATDTLPANVKRLAVIGSRGSNKVLMANVSNEGKPAGVFSSGKALKIAAMVLGPVLLAASFFMPPFAAAAGSVILSVIGLPQIWTNFKRGRDATQHQAIGLSMNWLAAAVFLTMTSVVNGAALPWILANVAGGIEAIIVALQIKLTRNDAETSKAFKKGLWILAGSLVGFFALGTLLGPTILSVWMPKSMVMAFAVAFLYMLPFPQIKASYELWQKERKIPDGVNPLYPGLVALGSILHLVAAISFGDILWAINAAVAISTSAAILSQIFFPAVANPLLAPIVKLFSFGKKAQPSEPAPAPAPTPTTPAPTMPAPEPMKPAPAPEPTTPVPAPTTPAPTMPAPEPMKPAPAPEPTTPAPAPTAPAPEPQKPVYVPKTDAELAKDAFKLSKQWADEGDSAFSMINTARAYEKGDGVRRDKTKAYLYYALAVARQDLRVAYDSMRELQKTMSKRQIARAQQRALFRVMPEQNRRRKAMSAAEFRNMLSDIAKTRVMLSGAWGFPDFDASASAYGDYRDKVKDVSFRPGYAMLKAIAQDVAKAGYATLNPWIVNLNDIFIDGVMFGAGPGVDGNPWSEGKLADKSMPKERLLEWIKVLHKDYRLRGVKSQYRYSADDSYEKLEDVYRTMVRDAIYRANIKNLRQSEIMFVNLNAYRGDADDGTVWEAVEAVKQGKEVLLLVDEKPAASLNEGIFGSTNQWNVMLSGFFGEHKDKVKIFHSVADVLSYLEDVSPDNPDNTLEVISFLQAAGSLYGATPR